MSARAAWAQPAGERPDRSAELARALRLSGLLALAAAIATAPCVLSAIGATSQSAGALQEPFLAIEILLALGLAGLVALAAGELELARARVLLPFAVFVLLMAVRSLWAREPLAAEREVVRWAQALAVLLAALLLVRREDEARCLLVLLAACAAAYAAYGLFQRWHLLPALERQIIRDPASFREQAGLALDRAARLRIMGRDIYGPFSISNHFAAYLGAALCVLLALAAGRVRTRKRPGAAVLACLAPAALLAAALVLTDSKGGWLASAAGAALLALLVLVPERRKRWGWALALGALALAALAVALSPWVRAHFTDSVRVRLGYWGGARRMIAEHPLLGVGPGGYPANYWRYKLVTASEAAEPHNQLLATWAELGLVGLLAYLWLWAAFVRDAPAFAAASAGGANGAAGAADAAGAAAGAKENEEARKVRAFAGLGGAGGLAAAAFFLFQREFSLLLGGEVRRGDLVALALAATVTLAMLAVYAGTYFLLTMPHAGASRRAWRIGAVAGASVVGLHALIDFDLRTAGLLVSLALLLALAGMRGRGGVRLALGDRGRVLLGVALALVVLLGAQYGFRRPTAIAVYGLDAVAAEQMARKAGARRPPDRAAWREAMAERVRAFKRLLRVVSQDWHAHEGLAYTYEELGFFSEAECEFEAAVRCAPDRPRPRATLGEFLLRRSRWREAAARFAEARERYPARAVSHAAEGDALLLASDREAAALCYAEALRLDRVLDEQDGQGNLFALFGRAGALPLHSAAVLEKLTGALGDAPEGPAFAWRRALAACERAAAAPDREEAAAAWEEAVRRFRALAEADPEDLQWTVFLGYALLGAGRGEEAERAWRSALARWGRTPPEKRLPRRVIWRAVSSARQAEAWRRRREAMLATDGKGGTR